MNEPDLDEGTDYRPLCVLCLDAGDSCLACTPTHADPEPVQRAITAWLAEQAEVTA